MAIIKYNNSFMHHQEVSHPLKMRMFFKFCTCALDRFIWKLQMSYTPVSALYHGIWECAKNRLTWFYFAYQNLSNAFTTCCVPRCSVCSAISTWVHSVLSSVPSHKRHHKFIMHAIFIWRQNFLVEYLLQVSISKNNYVLNGQCCVCRWVPIKRFERHKTANASAERSGELKFLVACSL